MAASNSLSTTRGREALIEVLKLTRSITDWSSLSLLMGLESHEFKQITRNAVNPQMDIIQTWFDRGKASWARLAEYLHHPLVNQITLAKEIEANHRKTTGDGALINQTEYESSPVFEMTPVFEQLEFILRDYSADYDNIGRILGLDYATRRRINVDNIQYLGPQKKLNAMIHECLERRKSGLTWKAIVVALRDNNMNKLADSIGKYLRRSDIQEFYTNRDT